MGKKLKTVSLICTLTLVSGLFTDSSSSYAHNESRSDIITESVSTFVDAIARNYSMFDRWEGASVSLATDYSFNDAVVYSVIGDYDEILGYVAADDNGKVISYSLEAEPDEFAISYLSVYSAEKPDVDVSNVGTRTSTYNVLSGLNPQLQGNTNCIAAAAANVMWYYSHNGYPTLTGSYTWDYIKNFMSYCYVSAGGFANNNSASAFSTYVNYMDSSKNATVSVNWNPAFSLFTSEIDLGKPVMLGFAAGSPFSQTVGHMTMGCGYMYLNNNWYVYVVDGWSTGPNFYIWDSNINDCIITVHIS
ncbi:MAG: hypothetical protein IKO30_00950 [Lachnospiraceae bacterium]|nr:hypothetical protein [Lachnospiraceae bacterium]